jgi:hypothetical protein
MLEDNSCVKVVVHFPNYHNHNYSVKLRLALTGFRKAFLSRFRAVFFNFFHKFLSRGFLKFFEDCQGDFFEKNWGVFNPPGLLGATPLIYLDNFIWPVMMVALSNETLLIKYFTRIISTRFNFIY